MPLLKKLITHLHHGLYLLFFLVVFLIYLAFGTDTDWDDQEFKED